MIAGDLRMLAFNTVNQRINCNDLIVAKEPSDKPYIVFYFFVFVVFSFFVLSVAIVCVISLILRWVFAPKFFAP